MRGRPHTRPVDAFETLWSRVEDPKEQMELAVLYLVILRDLEGVVAERDRLVELVGTRHGWDPVRTRRRLARLVELGIVVEERSLDDRPIYRLPD